MSITLYPPHIGEYGNRSFATTGTSSSIFVRILVPSFFKTSDSVDGEKSVGGQKTLSLMARVEPKIPGTNINGLSIIMLDHCEQEQRNV
jgi:hypothetical protein